jgi:hypothetical protein
MMHVIAWREGLNAPKAWMLDALRQHKVPIERAAARRHLSEGHAHLEGNARFLRQNGHTAARPHRDGKRIIQGADFRRLAAKVVRQIMPPASVGLIAIGETTAALWTTPKWLASGTNVSHRHTGHPAVQHIGDRDWAESRRSG